MAIQRLLTATESASFYLRHPIIAEQIAKTKLAIETGVYDWTQTLPQWFFEMIPPWGTQVADSSYGNVTVYFGTDGTLYLSGWTAENADINKPAYTPPPVKCKDGSDPILGICPSDFSLTPILIALGLVAALAFLPKRWTR
jgi:hypothetical protein